MKLVRLPQVASTNSWLLENLSKGVSFEDESVVYTLRQTQGRGQMGNRWESEPDKNITFSILLKPSFLPIKRQFLLSELCSLGVIDGLKQVSNDQFMDALCIKWPNDIYFGDEKLGGILIENRLAGSAFSECVLGIGLNVNQTEWIGDAPNPTSLLLKGINTTPPEVLDAISECILHRYHLLQADPESYSSALHDEFILHLYRREGFHPYVDGQTGEPFDAALEGVDLQGPLLLRLADGEVRHYWFKEVRFVLPCGVTKE